MPRARLDATTSSRLVVAASSLPKSGRAGCVSGHTRLPWLLLFSSLNASHHTHSTRAVIGSTEDVALSAAPAPPFCATPSSFPSFPLPPASRTMPLPAYVLQGEYVVHAYRQQGTAAVQGLGANH